MSALPAPARAWPWLLALTLAIFVYFFALDSRYSATNGDELLYVQITRVTADSGQWLPLQSAVERHRNTKPPALFWQGIVTTDWGAQWDLWRLRWPNVVYTLGLAAMVFLLARRLGGSVITGSAAALAYLCFFGTFRYGRVFLTSAPETFWIFLPFCILLLQRREEREPFHLSWPLALAFGLSFGIGLLYKSFALVVPAAGGLAWWTLHARQYRIREWLRCDAAKIAAAGFLALAVFSLWFLLDPARHQLWQDFVLKENVRKFDTKGRSYFLRLLWGDSSLWRIVVSYPINAGLLAPALLAVFVLAFRRRKSLLSGEIFLWIWAAAVFAFFILPDQRDERYLLLGMPALAAVCGLYWSQIPRWVLGISLLAVAVIALGFAAGALLATNDAGLGALYPWYFWILTVGLVAFAVTAMVRASWTHAAALPAILLLYLGYGLFSAPFDGPAGRFDAASLATAQGRSPGVPTNFGAREELYRFLLPGSEPHPYRIRSSTSLDTVRNEYDFFIFQVPLNDETLQNDPGLRVIGSRLHLVDRFNDRETKEMLMGRVSPHLFKRDLLVEVVPAAEAPVNLPATAPE